MILNDVHEGIQKHKNRKRIGRGPGSGHGKTAGRGHKGFFSRSGSKRRRGYEGGQMPLMRRIAKRGFSNARFADEVAIINLSQIEKAFEAGETVSPDTLHEKGVLRSGYDVLKVLGNGKLTKKLTVQAHRFSKSAAEQITSAGGKMLTIERPQFVGKPVKREKKETAK
jgi:large subunit ribosomal protein L15